MLDRPRCQPDRIFTVRHKFNSILDDVIKGKKNQYTIEPQGLAHDTRNFMYNNQLSARGEKLLWLDIDRQIESFDYDKQVDNSVTTTPPSALHKYQHQTPRCIKHNAFQFQSAGCRTLPLPPPERLYHGHPEARRHKVMHVHPHSTKHR